MTQHAGPFLTMYEFESRNTGSWIEALEYSVPLLGFEYAPLGKVWRAKDRKPLVNGLSWAPGLKLDRCHFFQKLIVSPATFIFESDEKQPSDKPMFELLDGGDFPEHEPKSNQISSIIEFMSQLSEKLPTCSPDPVTPEHIFENLRTATSYVTANNRQACVDQSLADLLKRGGLFEVPKNFKLSVITSADAGSIGTLLASGLRAAFSDLNITLGIQTYGTDRLQKSIRDFEAANQSPTPGHVALIGVEGKTGDPVPAEIEEILLRMDRNRIPYRLFSVNNDAIKWSTFDMAGILVQLAGGQPFRLNLPLPDRFDQPVFIGLDLGHPFKSESSILAVTVVDRYGRLIAYWTGDQPRDETIFRPALEKALDYLWGVLAKRFPDGFEPIVFRDGRMFENETLVPFEKRFGGMFTFVEIRKSRVPLFCNGFDTVLPGTACRVPGSDELILLAHSSNTPNHLLNPIRVRIVRDDLNIGDEQILQIITGLCYSPRLGLMPSRIPAPQRWADGLAGNSPTDHRFRGLHFVEHN